MTVGTTTETEEPTGPDFGGWTPTGRKTAGADSELIEVQNPAEEIQTAIVYDKRWAENPHLTTDVELVQTFMEFPMVLGLSCLTSAQIGKGYFQYDTGSVLALHEVMRAYRDNRKVVGMKAAVELCQAVGSMLQEASENGPMHGIYSSGGLTPWRIMLDAEGEVQLVGYGLPQMDMVALREDAKLKVRDDSYRYCPPERLTSGYEDISSDLYGLTLMAYEMITGESLLEGRGADLKKKVSMGEAQGQLMSDAKNLPGPLHEAFVKALAFDPIGRFEHPWEFVQAVAVADEQFELTGQSLAEIMEEVRTTTRRGKALTMGGGGGARRGAAGGRATRTRSAADAKPVRGPVGPGARRTRGKAKKSSVEGGGRWGSVARSKDESEEDKPRAAVAGRPSRRKRGAAAEADADKPSVATSSRRRRRGADDEEESKSTSPVARSSRRRRGSEEDDEPSAKRTRRGRGAATEDEEEEAPTRSRRGRSSASEDEAKEAAPTRSRRGRSSASEDDEAKEAAPTRSRRSRGAASEDDEPKKEAAPTRSRRSRGAAKEDDEPKKEAAPEKEAAPSRSRRSRGAAKEEDEPKAAAPEKEEAKEAAPTRSRRSRGAVKDEDEPKKEAAPSRSRRSRGAASEDDEPKEAAPSRSRRSRGAAKDEDEPKKEAAPTRGRRSRGAAKEDDEPKTPTRSRRSRRSSTKDD